MLGYVEILWSNTCYGLFRLMELFLVALVGLSDLLTQCRMGARTCRGLILISLGVVVDVGRLIFNYSAVWVGGDLRLGSLMAESLGGFAICLNLTVLEGSADFPPYTSHERTVRLDRFSCILHTKKVGPTTLVQFRTYRQAASPLLLQPA